MTEAGHYFERHLNRHESRDLLRQMKGNQVFKWWIELYVKNTSLNRQLSPICEPLEADWSSTD